jgi:predicted GNAT superfamily acetyltransferase
MGVIIRPVQTIDEYHACEALQRQAWPMDDDLEVVPLHLLLSVHNNGGLLLGAFDGDEMVGFVFGHPGLTGEGKLKHCSHMMGVRPQKQSTGIGYQLKLAQRQAVLEQGLDLVTWTYDPLLSRNAYLNLHKLGVVSRTYLPDHYGPLCDGLNAGLPTDRFEVEWWIASPRVQGRLGGREGDPLRAPAVQANRTRRTAAGFLEPGALTLEAGPAMVLVEIPDDYQAMKAAVPALALDWRLATRQLFAFYFAAGYTAVDFLSQQSEGERRGFYVLRFGWNGQSAGETGVRT